MDLTQHPRRYRQVARAAAVEATGERIVAAFAAALAVRWFDEIRLDDVAREAGVTVQTVIRRFGTKEGLLAPAAERIGREVRRRRSPASPTITSAIAALAMDYEASGDLVLRMLAQEDRHPALGPALEIGRAGHRDWVDETFAPWLDGAAPQARADRLDALVAVTDVYLWKLYRRDMERSAQQYRTSIERLTAAALLEPHPEGPTDDRRASE